MDRIAKWQRDDIRKRARNVTQAVQIAAEHVMAHWLMDDQAAYIAEAARSFAEGWEHVRRALRKDEWANADLVDYTRQAMRHQLLDTITRQGLIPVALPAETLHYMDRFFYPGTDDIERAPGGIPSEAVKAGAEWETVIIELSAPVRRPPVDRAAAVRAGILAGTVTPDGR